MTKNEMKLTDRELDEIYNEAKLAGDTDLCNWVSDALIHGEDEVGEASRIAISDRIGRGSWSSNPAIVESHWPSQNRWFIGVDVANSPTRRD